VGGLDTVALERLIARCEINAQTYKDAIKKERKTQEEYRQITLNPKRMAVFDAKAMADLINKCDVNVQIFQAAIQKEMDSKAEHQRILAFLKEKAANPPKVEVEVIRKPANDIDIGDDED
jgi:hypothetical protein